MISSDSDSRGEQLSQLRVVVQRLKDDKLSVGISKRGLVTQEVKYSGYIIRRGEIVPEPRKVQAPKNYPAVLESVKQARGFLGLAGYYRQLTTDLNEKAKPLHDKEKSELEWKP